MKNNSPTLAKIEQFARNELKSLLGQCTPKQKMVFNRMYSHLNLDATADECVDNMPYDKVPWAIQQCEYTIAGNAKKEPG